MSATHVFSKGLREASLKVVAMEREIRCTTANRKYARKQFKIRGKRRAPVLVKANDVRRHRYLRDHDLPHSATLAAVRLVKPKRSIDLPDESSAMRQLAALACAGLSRAA